MSSGIWRINTDDVEDFIASQEKVVSHQIRRDLDKLRLQGDRARHPLVGRFERSIRYLRSKVSHHGIFRVFYFKDGEESFRAFYAFQKKTRKIPNPVKKRVRARYKKIQEGG